MTMTCSVCNSYHRHSVDQALMQGHSYAKIARDYDLSADAVRNHHLNHLSRQLVQAFERRQDAESRDLLAEIDDLVTRTKKILDKAEKKGQLKTALAGIRELRSSYELMSRIAFSLHQAKQQDMELKKIESGEHDHQLEQEFRENLKILSSPELLILTALMQKIESQDPDMNCVAQALDRDRLKMMWIENPTELDLVFKPLGIKEVDLLEPLTIEPLEPLGLYTPDPEPTPDPPMTRTKKRGPGRPPGSKNKRKPFVRKNRTLGEAAD